MGYIVGSIETEEELDNGDYMVVSWQYYYEPGKPAPDCSNPASVLYAIPDEAEEFGIDGAVIVCATDENGDVIPVNDGHRNRLAGLMASRENDDEIYKAAKAMYEREIKFRAEWAID